MKKTYFERAQSLVLIALMMVAFVALLALVLDGGTSLAMRRKAQNAADAGALAGAQWLCQHLDDVDAEASAEAVANDYAVTKNKATKSDALADLATKVVSVTAYVRHETFFARLIGSDVVTPTANAVAKCYPAGGFGVLPIAWACRPPEGLPVPASFDCAELPDTPYIVMDSESVNVDFYCQDPPNSGGVIRDGVWVVDPEALDCDFNNDGVNEILAGGDRSWLDLNGGGGGASSMSDWIINGFPNEIFPHTWLAGQSGADVSVFQTAWEREGDVVVIPVFDKYCDGDPQVTPGCEWCLSEPDENIVYTSAASQLYYHVIGFTLFQIDCVDAGPFKDCPFRTQLMDANVLDGNVNTIEGHFVKGVVYGHGSGGIDQPWTGAFVVRLVK